jgi:hypothetical protein
MSRQEVPKSALDQAVCLPCRAATVLHCAMFRDVKDRAHEMRGREVRSHDSLSV